MGVDRKCDNQVPTTVYSPCEGEFVFNPYCGAYVCLECGNHSGLARCYCGWTLSGGDGYSELVEMGETIEDDY